jgi:hypothetical protein
VTAGRIDTGRANRFADPGRPTCVGRIGWVFFCAALVAMPGQAQESRPGARHDIGSGAGNIGKGAAKGTGEAAKGVGKGALDLASLHPVNAATSVGKGAASAGKDVTVGTAKGSGKIARGIGKAFRKIF